MSQKKRVKNFLVDTLAVISSEAVVYSCITSRGRFSHFTLD